MGRPDGNETTFHVDWSRSELPRWTLIHQSSRQGSNDRSVSRPPCAVVSRVMVMMVPARTSDQRAACVKVISPCGTVPSANQTIWPLVVGSPVVLGGPAETHWIFQPRRSAWSRVTTNSTQSPPFPMRRPKNGSMSGDDSPARTQVSPAASWPQPSQRSSRTALNSLTMRSEPANAADAAARGTMAMVLGRVFIERVSGVRASTILAPDDGAHPKDVQVAFSSRSTRDRTRPACDLNRGFT